MRPDVESAALRLRGKVQGQLGHMSLSVEVATLNGIPAARHERKLAQGGFSFEVPVPSSTLWSPEAPNLYRVDAVVRRGGEVLDALSERVGFVKLSTRGKHFLINDEPYYMCGTGDYIPALDHATPPCPLENWELFLNLIRQQFPSSEG